MTAFAIAECLLGSELCIRDCVYTIGGAVRSLSVPEALPIIGFAVLGPVCL
jgi:hypothetical protein